MPQMPDQGLSHAALHLAKYAGELAAIAEHLGHPDEPAKVERARFLARRWLRKTRRHAVLYTLRTADDLLAALTAEVAA